MGKLIVFNMVTLDGFFEGPNGEIDWHHVDEEFNQFAAEQLNSVDMLLFGRVTYQLMAQYWPTPTAIKNDPIIAKKMNAKSKIVCSRTLKKTDWNNTRLIGENTAEELSKMKARPGKDLIIFGSANLAGSLTVLGLIDEYRLMVNPVVLGGGRPLFKPGGNRLDLKLLTARAFRSGNVLLCYQSEKRGG